MGCCSWQTSSGCRLLTKRRMSPLLRWVTRAPQGPASALRPGGARGGMWWSSSWQGPAAAGWLLGSAGGRFAAAAPRPQNPENARATWPACSPHPGPPVFLCSAGRSPGRPRYYVLHRRRGVGHGYLAQRAPAQPLPGRCVTGVITCTPHPGVREITPPPARRPARARLGACSARRRRAPRSSSSTGRAGVAAGFVECSALRTSPSCRRHLSLPPRLQSRVVAGTCARWSSSATPSTA